MWLPSSPIVGEAPVSEAPVVAHKAGHVRILPAPLYRKGAARQAGEAMRLATGTGGRGRFHE